MSRWRARLLGQLAVALILAPFSGAQAGGAAVIFVPFPPFFNAAPPPPRTAPPPAEQLERLGYPPQAAELMPQRPPPAGQCYTPTAICSLSDRALVGHPCSCDTKTGRVAGRGLIPPSVSLTAERGGHPASGG